MNIIEVNDVSKRFSQHLALDKVSLQIREGVVFGLLGPNGAGKTTLIRILNQIIYPDSGTILFQGHPLRGEDVRQIGYLPEERGLYKKMKAGEQALYLAQLKGMDRGEALKRLHQKFDQYGISDWWNRPIEELSKGMQQKVQFIITTIHRPNFLILDEPFSGFDPINANLLKEEILQLKHSGTTIVLSTHNMASVEEICDEIALINKSKKILEGNIHEIRHRFRKHLYSVEIAGEDPSLEQLVREHYICEARTILPHSIEYTLRLPDDSHLNTLLNTFMEHGTLVSFRQMLPSMNDIFIEQVEQFNRNGHETA